VNYKVEAVTLDGFDPGAMDETVKQSRITHVQLASGRFRGRLLGAAWGSQRLDYGHYNLPLHARGHLPETGVTLGFVLQNRQTTHLNGYAIEGPTLALLPEGETLDYRLAPDTKWVAFQTSRDSLERLGIDTSFLAQPLVSGECTSSMNRLRRTLQEAMSCLEEVAAEAGEIAAPQQFGRHIFGDVMDAFHAVLVVDDTRGEHLPRRRASEAYLVRRATDYIDAHLAEPLQIGTLCVELTTNWRSLEAAFRRLLGITPKRYVQLARLARTRRLLLQSRKAGRTVAEVALACGISHLGRFSRAYYSAFGEMPSETLRRG